MGILQINQIAQHLEECFEEFIDKSDINQRKETERRRNILSRCLAAFAINVMTGADPSASGSSVIDGRKDNGIDAIYWNRLEKSIYIVQSKWTQEGKSTPDSSDIHKFLQGIKDLISSRMERFNEKLKEKKLDDQVSEALKDSQVRIFMILIHTSSQRISDEQRSLINDFLRDMNDSSDAFIFEEFDQRRIHSCIAQGVQSGPVNLEITLTDWGRESDPITSYYGKISAVDVASWYSQHRSNLFTSNIRIFLGKTEVNNGIIETLTESPQYMWYFNNGITALAQGIRKKVAPDRGIGQFECQNFRIINGAQTVGSIYSAYQQHGESISRANVQMRIISLEDCPEEFEKLVTRYNNTQNKIDSREFVALDPVQENLRIDLKISKIDYFYKSGEIDDDLSEKSFDLTEATIARACYQDDLSFTVKSKDKIGSLWEDIERSPYKQLFNKGLDALKLWKIVQILKVSNSALAVEKKSRQKREALIMTHGNRLILYCSYRILGSEICESNEELTTSQTDIVCSLTKEILQKLIETVNLCYPDAHLAYIFKNKEKCQDISDKVLTAEFVEKWRKDLDSRW